MTIETNEDLLAAAEAATDEAATDEAVLALQRCRSDLASLGDWLTAAEAARDAIKAITLLEAGYGDGDPFGTVGEWAGRQPLSTFDHAVLEEIGRQRSYGARFPSPVGLRYSGEPTDAARRLGDPSEREVMVSVRRLHRAREVLFIRRHGYTWVIIPNQAHTHDEVVDGPRYVNRPTYWDEI